MVNFEENSRAEEKHRVKLSLPCLLECFKAKKSLDKFNAVYDGGLFHGFGSNPKKTPAHQDEDLQIQLKKRFDAPMHQASKQF